MFQALPSSACGLAFPDSLGELLIIILIRLPTPPALLEVPSHPRCPQTLSCTWCEPVAVRIQGNPSWFGAGLGWRRGAGALGSVREESSFTPHLCRCVGCDRVVARGGTVPELRLPHLPLSP